MIATEKCLMSPLQINILLHYYSRGDDFPDITSSSQIEIISDYVECGIMTELSACSKCFRLTDRGICYIQAIIYAASQLSLPKWSVRELHGKDNGS